MTSDATIDEGLEPAGIVLGVKLNAASPIPVLLFKLTVAPPP